MPLRFLAIATSLVVLLAAPPREARSEQWTETTPTGVSLNAMAFLSATDVIAVGANGTILRSTTAGVSWNPSVPGSGENLNAIAFSGATGVAVGANGEVLVTTNSGVAWNQKAVVGGLSRELHAVAFDGNTMVAVGDKAGNDFTIVRSTDAPNYNTWTKVGPTSGGNDLYALTFSTAADLVAVGKAGVILRSDNGGASWGAAVVQNDADGKTLNKVVASGATVIAVGDKDAPNSVTIQQSVNGGATWDHPAQNVSDAVPINDVVFVNPTTLVAVGNKKGAGGFRIFIGTNSGGTWNEAILPAGSADLTAVASGNGLVLAVGENGTILSSTDSGSNWALDDTQGSTANLLDVAIINPAIAVGSGGEALLRIPSGAGASGLSGGFTGIIALGSDTLDVPFGHEWVYALLLVLLIWRRLG